ncbi:hypothetical protein FIBSPDRAFT_1040542 [Athelia psychrophila]|uniref:Uncharacterized protein n=1 Tax=Athelia psychrophila TaxID=1759441 RepID=A0A166Q605_9AGAM|nr:hypothetical protein FIBSPDRAFT_1040542 [Fibularhizoctonia sp. CBS 109695]
MLSSRSSPTLPPAKTAHDPLVKTVLAQLEGSGFGSFVWTMHPEDLAAVCSELGAGCVAVVLLRKFFTAQPSIASSPSKALQIALSKLSTLHALLAYTTSAILAILMHNFATYFENKDPWQCRSWISCKSREAVQLQRVHTQIQMVTMDCAS